MKIPNFEFCFSFLNESMMNRCNFYGIQFTPCGLKTFYSSQAFMYHPIMSTSELISKRESTFFDLKKMGWRPIPGGNSKITFFSRELLHQDCDTMLECCVSYFELCPNNMCQHSAFLLTPSKMEKIQSSSIFAFSEREVMKKIHIEELVRDGWIETPFDKFNIASSVCMFFIKPYH